MRISSLLALVAPAAALALAPLAQAQSQTQGHGQDRPQIQPPRPQPPKPQPPRPQPPRPQPPRPQPPRPQPAQWRILAFKTVGAGTDRDTILVRRADRYRTLQLCSFNAPIRMVDFKVRFDNGRWQDVRVRSMVAARSCTREIRLEGNGARRIQRVDLTYERIQRGMRTPLIRVMAR